MVGVDVRTEGQPTHVSAGEALGAQPLHVEFGACASARVPLSMPMDLYRSGDGYMLHADLPGVDPDSVDVSVDGGILTVTAQRNPGAVPSSCAASLSMSRKGSGCSTATTSYIVGCRTSPPRRVSAGCAPCGVALHPREHQGCRRAQVVGDEDPGVQDRRPREKGQTRLDLLVDVGAMSASTLSIRPTMCANRNWCRIWPLSAFDAATYALANFAVISA